jgi:light-regulated signal transduction histidine kinase (bacteriophytochrome)
LETLAQAIGVPLDNSSLTVLVKAVDDRGRLHPRRSFRSWEEIVRGKSEPWAQAEIAGALDLRQSLVGIVLHRG